MADEIETLDRCPARGYALQAFPAACASRRLHRCTESGRTGAGVGTVRADTLEISEWEALSISSTFMVWLTAVFLVVLMSAPVLKIVFINRREHLRLRELGFLGFLLVWLT